ncbi:unnamed protein product [Onchocerca ochengi]|uniref:SCP2 domain-containing protein n=1 Tax=Onchocerca ochengi TaxID=42157 RepID=A0A182EV33_ONCOC|nr:unnamed protein product [Onchocerca ochengi]
MIALYRLAEPSSTTVKIPAKKIFLSDGIFDEIKERAKMENDLTQNINSSFRFILTGPDNAVKKWVVDCKVKPPVVIEMGEGDVDVEMTMKDSDFIEIVNGKLRPDQAFLQRRLKIKGNLAKAMKLRTLLKSGLLKAKL